MLNITEGESSLKKEDHSKVKNEFNDSQMTKIAGDLVEKRCTVDSMEDTSANTNLQDIRSHEYSTNISLNEDTKNASAYDKIISNEDLNKISAGKYKDKISNDEFSKVSTTEISNYVNANKNSTDEFIDEISNNEGSNKISTDEHLEEISNDKDSNKISADGNIDEISNDEESKIIGTDKPINEITNDENSKEIIVDESIDKINKEDGTQLIDMLLQELQCSVCWDPMIIPRSPLLCTRGHSICTSCVSSVNFCPSCRNIQFFWTRNLPLENICNCLVYLGYLEANPDPIPAPTSSIASKVGRSAMVLWRWATNFLDILRNPMTWLVLSLFSSFLQVLVINLPIPVQTQVVLIEGLRCAGLAFLCISIFIISLYINL